MQEPLDFQVHIVPPEGMPAYQALPPAVPREILAVLGGEDALVLVEADDHRLYDVLATRCVRCHEAACTVAGCPHRVICRACGEAGARTFLGRFDTETYHESCSPFGMCELCHVYVPAETLRTDPRHPDEPSLRLCPRCAVKRGYVPGCDVEAETERYGVSFHERCSLPGEWVDEIAEYRCAAHQCQPAETVTP